MTMPVAADAVAAPGAAPPREDVPPLENGDRLTREEFERRYSAMPGLKKAELIEGVVYIPNPVVRRDGSVASPLFEPSHGWPHGKLMAVFGVYLFETPGIHLSDNTSVRLDLDNESQPDAYLRVLEEFGGASRVENGRYTVGAPELIAEVASSSVSYDLGPKLHAFRRNGVREYLVWRVRDREIDWFALRGGAFERLPLTDGIYRSGFFKGLWLNVPAALNDDIPALAATARAGLASPEHAAFVAELLQRREQK